MTRAAPILAPIVLFVLLALLWQAIAAHTVSILPPLGAVAADLLARPGFYVANLAVTLRAALSGFVAGSLAAVLLAVLADSVPLLSLAIMPAALLLNVTPVVAIAPALIVAFGFNATPHIIVAGVAAFFPMLINAGAGLRAASPQALEVLACMGASRADVIWRLKLPASLGFLFTGAKLSLSAALVGAVVSEFSGTSHGLGAAIVTATMFLNLNQMWGAIFVSAAASMLLVALVGALQRLVVKW